MTIQKRMVITAMIPLLLGIGIVLLMIQNMPAEQDYNPTIAQYLGSMWYAIPTIAQYLGSLWYAIAVLIAAWEFMFWIIKASWRTGGLRIPLVLAIVTGWWAYGMVTLNFSTAESPYTGETAQLGDAMLSALPLIPINGLLMEGVAEFETTGEIPDKIIAVYLTIYLPMMFSSLIIFLTVPLGWVILAVGRARKTDWEELLWKILRKIRRRPRGW